MIAREQADNLAFTLLRIGAGIIVIPHGISQLTGGNDSVAQITLAQVGVAPSSMASYLIIYLELIGGVCLAVGFLTRIFASALAVEMMWVASIFWSNPLRSNSEYEAWEFPLVLGIVLLLLAVQGGGPWSVDRFVTKQR